MARFAADVPIAAANSDPIGLRRPAYATTIWLFAAFCVVLFINPVGFIGGGQDDGRYLEAARCWAAHGACVPINHWQGRWLVFAPIALFTALFGESRAAVQIWPLLCSAAALLLFAEIARRLFGERVALVAGLLLLATPAYSLQILTPSVEAIELCFVLGGILSLLLWCPSSRSVYALQSGLCFGLAFQVRETAVLAAAVAVAAIYIVGFRPRLAHLALAAAGFAIPLAIEFAAYAFATGDPLFRRRLSLSHGSLPSTELANSVDRTKSPILNPDFIGGWRREPGVKIHWLVDGPVNLLFNAKAGFSLILAPLLLFAAKRDIPPTVRHAAWRLLGFGAAYLALVTYFLAMDPKPRVMMLTLTSSSLAFAIAATALLRSDRRALAGTCLFAAGLGGLIVIASYIRPVWAAQQARIWSAKYPQAIETDRMTRLMLTLDPDARKMPGLVADKPYVMIIGTHNCRSWISISGLRPNSIELKDQRSLVLLPELSGAEVYSCLFRYRVPISGLRMKHAINRTWTDPTG